MKRNSHKAFISYDALFSILPVVFLVAFILQVMAFVAADANQVMDKRATFDFLVVTADYAVKSGAAETDAAGNTIPNWLSQQKLQQLQNELNENVARNISLSLGSPGPGSVCIYRLVAVGSSPRSGKIDKLYVCGDYANS
ncbi:MAG: hypothetical protein V1492_00620 [Candidatus Micrarchaeota archaeon]